MEKIIKYAGAAVLGTLATLSERYSWVVLLVALAVILDIITGLIRSKITGIPISSRKGCIGFWKKISLFAGLFFGIFLDGAIPTAMTAAGMRLSIALPFGMIIGCYILINECISISENLYQSNPDILPKWVAKLLVGLKNKINEEERK